MLQMRFQAELYVIVFMKLSTKQCSTLCPTVTERCRCERSESAQEMGDSPSTAHIAKIMLWAI